jgi:hypothetical protein
VLAEKTWANGQICGWLVPEKIKLSRGFTQIATIGIPLNWFFVWDAFRRPFMITRFFVYGVAKYFLE